MHFDFTPKFCVHIVIAVTMLMALLRQITPYAIPNFATLPIFSFAGMVASIPGGVIRKGGYEQKMAGCGNDGNDGARGDGFDVYGL